MVPIALTIAGSDSSGGAGIQADLKTFTVLGVYGASVLTALTAQNTQGVQGVLPVDPPFVAQQIRSVMSDLEVGAAEVRQLFKVSKVGTIAGSMVVKGKIVRNFSCRIVRGGKKVHEGKVAGLKRFKDDVREVQEGFECGITVSNFKDYIEGDRIEVYEVQSKEPKQS